MSIYMADQPCIDMHKCSFHWGSGGEGKYAAISPLSMSMSNCLTCGGLDSLSNVLEKNKAAIKNLIKCY